MNKVLLTGGTGYIGQYMIKLLQRQGQSVIITSRKKDAKISNIENRHMELLDADSISGVCNGADIVIHMANLDETLIKDRPLEAFLANSYATRLLYLDAVKSGVKHFIYLSTFHVYGKGEGKIDENTQPEPKTDYAVSHYFAEEFLRQLSRDSSCKVSVVRLTNGIGLPLEGVKKWYLVFNDFCRTAYHDQKIIMKSNGLPIRDFIPIYDVVKAIGKLVELPVESGNKFEIYNISNEVTYSIREVAYKVKEQYEARYGKKIKMQIPEATQDQFDSIKPLLVSSQKLRSLGWKPELKIEDVINDIFDGLEKEIDIQSCLEGD